MSEYILYQRDNCHLCDLALDVLAAARFPEFDTVFIDENFDLEQQYGDMVPVIYHLSSGKILAWPFTVEMVRQWGSF